MEDIKKLFKGMTKKEMIRMAHKEIEEWIEVIANADAEILKWEAFINKLKKDDKKTCN